MLKSFFSKKPGKMLPFLLIPLVLSLAALFFCLRDRDSRLFSSLCETIFQEELAGNTLNLHYTLACPENYGIEHYPPALPCYQPGSGRTSSRRLEDYLDALERIDADHLSEDQRYTYTLLSRFLAQSQAGSRFAYYDEPLSPSAGMQSELPILLAEYAFRSRTDVEDYLALLDQTDEYFASLLLYEQEKKEAGLLQADTSLQQVREQCYSVLSKEELSSGTHFLQTTFQERLEHLTAQGILTEEEAAGYLSANDRLLTTVMQPAYEDLADGLFLLMGDGTSRPKGRAAYPQGREYYAWLTGRNTGSPLSMEEIKSLLYSRFESTYSSLHTLLTRDDSIEVWLLHQDTFPLLSPEEILTDLQARMAGHSGSLRVSRPGRQDRVRQSAGVLRARFLPDAAFGRYGKQCYLHQRKIHAPGTGSLYHSGARGVSRPSLSVCLQPAPYAAAGYRSCPSAALVWRLSGRLGAVRGVSFL